MNNEVTGIAGEPDIFDLTAASFPNYDHIEDILEMIPDLVAAVFTSLFGFFDNTKKMPVYEQSHAIYAQFDNFRYFINEVKFNEMKRFEVYPNDIIMSCSGTMGKVAIVPSNAPKGIINQALLKLSTNE